MPDIFSEKEKMSDQPKMFSSVLEWLHDWVSAYDSLPPLRDEYDLQTWMEEEMLEAVETFVQYAFQKQKTRSQALEILRGILWETYVFYRDVHLRNLNTDSEKAESTVTRLLALPQTAQKTVAWYTEARELLTGHEFAGAVYGTPKSLSALVAKKCGTEAVIGDMDTAVESRTVYICPLSPFQWGWRFEPVIRQLFEEEIAGGKVDDSLGRIRHPTLPRLAASPDGLIVEGPRKSRLVEIKAPISRILTKEIPEEYFCQMQLQAEVTDVEAVEYIEVRFSLLSDFATEEDFLQKLNYSFPERMGTVLIVGESTEQPDTWTYVYSPIWNLTAENLAIAKQWIPETMLESQNRSSHQILERSIWRVKQGWHTTVPRNRNWWEHVGKPAYEAFWKEVEEARESGKFKSKLLLVESDDEEE